MKKSKKITPMEFIYKIYYLLNYKRNSIKWKENVIKNISKELNNVKGLKKIIGDQNDNK